MSQQLGENYREYFSVSALPAFSKRGGASGTKVQITPKRQSKLLEKFDRRCAGKKPVLKGFLALLTEQLVSDSKAKITRSTSIKRELP